MSISPATTATATATAPAADAPVDLNALRAAAAARRAASAQTATSDAVSTAPATDTSTTVTPEARQTASAAVSEMRRLVMARVKEAGRMGDAQKLAESINVLDRECLASFGLEAQQATAAQARQMLEGVKVNQLGEVGQQLSSLVREMKGFPLEVQIKTSKFFGFLSNAKKQLGDAIEAYKVQHTDVNKVVDQFAADIFKKRQLLHMRNGQLDGMFDASVTALGEIDVHIAALIIAVEKAETVVIPALKADLAKDNTNAVKQQNLTTAIQMLDAVGRRIGALAKTYAVTARDLPDISQMQDGNYGLIEQIDEVLTTTIPIWQKLIAKALVRNEQKLIAGDLQETSDFTNELLLKDADDSAKMALAIQDQLDRGQITFETLEKMNASLIGMLETKQKAIEKARQERLDVENKLVKSQKDLAEAVVRTAA